MTSVGRGARTPPQVRAATRQRATTHVGGGVPDAPETFCRRPSPGKPPGRACPAPTARRWASPMPSVNARGGVKTPPYRPPHQRVPGPYRAAVGKPHAVHKRPRRGQDPSLRTAPSTSARPYSAYVNYIRRAGCPHPAASSRGYPSTGSHLRRGRRPRRPGNLLLPPIPGTPPGPGMPGPYRAAVGKPHAVRKRPRRGQDPSLRTAPSTSASPPTARRCGNGDKKTEAIPFPGTASVLYYKHISA